MEVKVLYRELWSTLIHDYNIPKGKKFALIKPPKIDEEKEIINYIKGWYDGEGWIEVMTTKRPYGIYQYPKVGFKIKNKPMRDWILKHLIQNGIRAKKYDRKDKSYGISIHGTNACNDFLKKIGFLNPSKIDYLKKLIIEKKGHVSSNQAGVR